MPSLTKRSVIRLGDNGLVITIPKAWALFNRIKPGDKLTVIVNDDMRILAPARISEGSSQDSEAAGARGEPPLAKTDNDSYTGNLAYRLQGLPQQVGKRTPETPEFVAKTRPEQTGVSGVSGVSGVCPPSPDIGDKVEGHGTDAGTPQLKNRTVGNGDIVSPDSGGDEVIL